MRFASAPGAGARRRASPYRVSAREGAGEGEPRARADGVTVGILVFVFACSLVRFGLFAFGAERFGRDPLLALLASAASAYYLRSLLGR